MWLANDKFKEINHAVVKGEPKGLLKLFGELSHPENQSSQKLTACPQCGKSLERKMHPYLEYFVQACPDRHGAWMSPDVSAKVRDLFESQIAQLSRRRKIAGFLAAGIALCFIFVMLSHSPIAVKDFLLSNHETDVRNTNQPQPIFTAFPEMTELAASIQNPGERDYLSRVAQLLEESALNRLSFQEGLRNTREEEEILELFEVYRKKQQAFLMKLRSVYVPEILNPFQESLQKAGEAQLVFYGVLAEARVKSAEDLFSQPPPHPALRLCREELVKAYEFLMTIYPQLDAQIRQAFEDRLSLFSSV